VIGRPNEFTREWAYTALSRGRQQTTINVIAEPNERDRQRDQYAPPAPCPDPAQIPENLRNAMRHRETEALAIRQGNNSPWALPQTTLALLPTRAPDAEPTTKFAPASNPVRGTTAPPRRLKTLGRLRRLGQERRGPSLHV
jgi:hypothetical protein